MSRLLLTDPVSPPPLSPPPLSHQPEKGTLVCFPRSTSKASKAAGSSIWNLEEGRRAVMDQAEQIKAAWRALPDEEKQRRLRPTRVTDAQFDAEREAEQCGVTVSDYLGGSP